MFLAFRHLFFGGRKYSVSNFGASRFWQKGGFMGKTKILEYIIGSAERAGDGNICATDFFGALFGAAELARSGSLWEVSHQIGAAAELALAMSMLGAGNTPTAELLSTLKSVTESDSYNKNEDRESYIMAEMAAEKTTLTSEHPEITIADYVKALSKTPISRKILGALRRVVRTSNDSGAETVRFKRAGKHDWGWGKPDSEVPAGTAEILESGEIENEELLEYIAETKKIREGLSEKILGQGHATETFASGYFMAKLMRRTKSDTKGPLASFLFAGAHGVGKTYLAECAAELLSLPYMKFDMSEYNDREAMFAFAGSNQVYKDAKGGNVTTFVKENPKCVLIFDEIEKAHPNVIHLFLQMLDTGRLRDNYTDEEVSFRGAVIIMTTNAGRSIYEGREYDLSRVSHKKIVKALAEDKDKISGLPLFPSAVCSRFAAGNVIMFNRLGTETLLAIANSTLRANIAPVKENMGIDVTFDDNVATALLYAEGGSTDARAVKSKSDAFIYREFYDIFRMSGDEAGAIKEVSVSLDLPESGDIRNLFVPAAPQNVLYIGGAMPASCDGVIIHHARCESEAEEILQNIEISLAIFDIETPISEEKLDTGVCDGENLPETEEKATVTEAAESIIEETATPSVSSEPYVNNGVHSEFVKKLIDKFGVATYITKADGEVSEEEKLAYTRIGARGIIPAGTEFTAALTGKCTLIYKEQCMARLFRMNKVLAYTTLKIISGGKVDIRLSNLSLSIMPDAADDSSVLDGVTRPKVKFSDVIGAEDAKDELEYFVKYLRDPKKFTKRGLKAPRGVLLYGPPGTGKTLLARALAGETDMAFIATEGNKFLKRYVGEGPEAMHEVFALARKYAPSILFIDEIDAIAKDRNAHETSGEALTAFLSEMDGFSDRDSSAPVFVLATTNYELGGGSRKRLDSAVMRRFDRTILVDLPKKAERIEFLKKRMADNPIIKLSDAGIENTAVRTTGMSLSTLEAVIELAMRNVAKADGEFVDDAALDFAFETYEFGEEKKWDNTSLQRTARHEAGHAILYWLSGGEPTYLTIVSRGDHTGYMQKGDEENRPGYTKEELFAEIRTYLAGRAAEIAYYGAAGGISTGASSDIERATQVARNMLCSYGMDDVIGPVFLGDEEAKRDPEVNRRIGEILREQLTRTVEIIKENKKAADILSDTLIERNHLRGDEIAEILSKNIKR